jgi:chemotaxis protein methyltransferase CheR
MRQETEGFAPELRDEDFSFFQTAILARAGISLKGTKHELVRSRLRARLTAHGLKNFNEYRRFLQGKPESDPEWEMFTNLLTTNKTDFFREPEHFDTLLHDILPAWLHTGAKTFSVWSSASSTGEEPYTLAMILSRALPPGRDFQILATDIDTNVLAVAANGVYSNAKYSEIPREYQQTCLDVGKKEVQGWFRIKRHLKERVVFQPHNLIKPALPSAAPFDLVLCRNVMIYFDRQTVDFVQTKLHSAVKPGGHLFIGHSESFQGLSHHWQPIEASVFRKGA